MTRREPTGPPTVRRMLPTLATVVLAGALSTAHAQTFSKVTSASNPIVADPVPSDAQYGGCAWMDFDGDGDQDLFIVQQGLYRNDGGGAFSRVPGMPGGGPGALGTTWGDYDNDGRPDCFLSGGDSFPGAIGGSKLYHNDGGGLFSLVGSGPMADSLGNRGWGSAWGDYDNDGRLDLVVAAPVGFVGITNPTRLFHNQGAGTFARLDTSVVSAATGPYTVPSWCDVDRDGDLDLFIASGPVDGTRAPDFLYTNHLVAPGQAFFTRLTTGALATDGHDGQLYNWIDIDEDGDLDCMVTNYGGSSGFANDLYRNDAGAFVKTTSAESGPIVTDTQHSLASMWGDFDNDGDLDCLVTNDGTELSLFYTNNGSGLFTRVATTPLRTSGPHYGAAAADYDGDGKLDIYMHGTTTTRGLFRNTSSDAGWLEVRCIGVTSNRSAIGATVRVRATIGGVARNLVQLISAQNSFNGHNSFDLHFGLGNATEAESVIVRFPGGIEQKLTHVAVRQRLTVVEETPTPVEVSLVRSEVAPERVRLVWMLGSQDSPMATIERSGVDLDWKAIGTATVDGSQRVTCEDRSVTAGSRYGYRLVVTNGTGSRALGETWVTVPVAGLRVAMLGPNPARGALRFSVAIPAAGSVELDLVDVAGQRVAHHAYSGLTAGNHALDLAAGRPLSPGIYWVRVRNAGQTAEARVVLLR